MTDTPKLFVASSACPVGIAVLAALRALEVRIETEVFQGESLPAHLANMGESLVAVLVPTAPPNKKVRIQGRHRILRPRDVDSIDARYLHIVLPEWARGLHLDDQPSKSQVVAYRHNALDNDYAFGQSIRTLCREITGLWLPAPRKAPRGQGAASHSRSAFHRRDLATPPYLGGQ